MLDISYLPPLDRRLFLTLIFQKCCSSQNSIEKFPLGQPTKYDFVFGACKEPVSLSEFFPAISERLASDAVQDTFLTWHVSMALLLNTSGIPKDNALLRTTGFPHSNGTYKGK